MIEGTRLEYHPYLSDDTPEAELADVTEVRRSAFRDAKAGMYVEPPYMAYGDYGGSLVERSNLEEFGETFEEYAGTEWWGWSGDYGSQGIIVRADADTRVPEIGEFFEGLQKYPLANEERHSELEQDAIEVAWVEYGRREFADEFIEMDPELGEAFEELDPVVIDYLRWAVEQAAGNGPEVEDAAGSVSFRVYRDIVKRTGEADPDALLVAFGLAFETANRGGHFQSDSALNYLFTELGSGWGGQKQKQMPAFYYALLEVEPKAARFLGTKEGAREFAELWMDQEELEETSILDDAKALGGLLHGMSQEKLAVFADLIEQNPQEALEFLDVGA